jgi:hypothetical protein
VDQRSHQGEAVELHVSRLACYFEHVALVAVDQIQAVAADFDATILGGSRPPRDHDLSFRAHLF